ncbi:MAG: hypothetical protein HC799_15065 [Limnothrix sp. RL_2_0]|nr:hypothetical protein [Limnothrix sp. RL_2_0]
MALFGLFGGKKNEPQTGDFFLDFEDAQTLGDTEYMKQSKTIKRTFPKLKGNPGKTIISQVSAENMRDVEPTQEAPRSSSSFGSFTSSFSAPAPSAPATAAQTPETPAPETPPAPKMQNVKVDSSMDMFRNMAKKISK